MTKTTLNTNVPSSFTHSRLNLETVTFFFLKGKMDKDSVCSAFLQSNSTHQYM